MSKVNKAVTALLEGLFPSSCTLCGLRSYRQFPLCADCQAEIRPNPDCCHRCAIPLPRMSAASAPRVCGQCLFSPPPFHRVIAPWLYSERMAYLIQRWKFGGEQRLTPLLASLWLQRVPSRTRVDVLIPVPLHWRRLWQRGFNQSELLCHQLRGARPALAAIPVAPRLVYRQRATAAQSGMGAGQRFGNLAGAFTARRSCDNLRVAIVDDVLTTGATAAAMARTLSAAGASHIEVWCLARTPAPGD